MRRRLTALVLCSLLALFGSSVAWGKGHVPLNKVQVCDLGGGGDDDDDDDGGGSSSSGEVDTIDESRLDEELARGNCRLPACDGANVFFENDSCNGDEDGDGFCELDAERAPAMTPLCFPGY